MSTWRQQMKQSLPLAPPQDGSSWQEIDWLAVSHILSQADEVVPPTSFYLVIDEGQDMPKEFYWAISDLGYTNIFVAADFNQVLHPGKNSNGKDLIGALEKTLRKVVSANAPKEKLFDPEAVVEISHNHRNPGPVARLAAHICQSLNNPQSTCPKLRADMRDAAVPLLFGYDPVGPKRNLDSVCRRVILTADRNPRWLIGVLCATKTMLDTYKQPLHGALTSVRQRLDHGDPRIEILDMGQQKEPDFSKGGIVLLTAHSCKGLEFDLVVIADIDTYWNNTPNHQLLYLDDLLSVKRIALPGAIVQMAVATVLGMILANWWGWSFGAGLVFGLSLSCASTVVLLKALESRGLLETMTGGIAVGWLIVEDLVTVLILVLLPSFATILGGSNSAESTTDPLWYTVGITLLLVSAFIALMLIVGRRVLPWLLWQVARTGSREMFTLAVVAVAICIAYGAAALFNVSFALGAFFAGMVMRESK